MNDVLKRDQNDVTVLGAITNDSDQFIKMLRIDPATGRLIVSAVIAGTYNGQLLVSAADTTYGYLFSKLSAGTGISLAIANAGGNETVEITATGTGYTTVQNNGNPLTQRTKLNFLNGFDVTDNAGNTSTDVVIDESELDLGLMGGLLDLSTQVTGVLNSTYIDISNLESNLDLANIAGLLNISSQVTGVLPLANGGTGSALTDPNANRLWGWDDTDGAIGFWTIGTGLSYDHATHTLNASAGTVYQSKIQFQDEGVNLGTAGTVDEVDFTGAGVTATRVGNKVTVDIPVVSASNLLKTMTANEDLTAGQTVGVSNFVTGDKVARSGRFMESITTSVTQNNNFDQYNANSACPIGGDKFAYLIAEASEDLYVIVGSVDTDTLDTTLGGAELVTNDLPTGSGDQYNASICKLDTDKFIVLYREQASTTIIKYRIGTVSGTTITLGAAATFTTAGSQVDSIASTYLSADKAVMFYGCATPTDSAVITFTTTGTATNVVGTPASVGTTLDNNTSQPVIIKVDTDTFFFFTNSGYAQAGTCIGTTNSTIGAEADTNINSSGDIGNNAKALTSTLIVVSGGTPGQIAEYSACTISGTTLTFGSALTGSQYYIGLYADSATSFIAQNYSGSAGVRRYTVSGTTITLDKTVILGISNFQNILTMDNGYYVLILQSATTFNINVQGMANAFLGIAQATVAKGATVSVLYSGQDANQTGLVAGSLYEPNGTGGLTLLNSQSNNFTAGKSPQMKAINSTTVII